MEHSQGLWNEETWSCLCYTDSVARVTITVVTMTTASVALNHLLGLNYNLCSSLL